MRREAIETVGGYEESFRGLYEDQAFYAKVCLKAPVFVSGGCWYKYRKHPDSCCAVAESRGRHHAERLLLLNWLESYLNENAIKDKGVWQSLKRAQWACRFPKLSRMPDHIPIPHKYDKRESEINRQADSSHTHIRIDQSPEAQGATCRLRRVQSGSAI